MKKSLTLLAAICCSLLFHAQTANVVVFSEDGDKFTLFLNGEQKNATPLSNVKVNGLTSTFYTAKIDFEDHKLPDISSKNFAVELGSEATYVIKKNKKGEYVLRFHSYSPISNTPSGSSSETGISDEARRLALVDDEEDTTVTPTTGISQSVTTPAGSVKVDVGVTETTTTTTTTNPSNGEKVSVGMNIGGVNMGININVNEGIEQSSNTAVTTTTTTRTTSSEAVETKQPVKERPSAHNPCGIKMANDAFAKAKKSIEDKGFDETRLTVAKQVANSNCLSVTQIREVMDVFSFEATKLEFAKYAYDHCANRNEYYLINDAFSYSSSIDELNEYIQSK